MENESGPSLFAHKTTKQKTPLNQYAFESNHMVVLDGKTSMMMSITSVIKSV